MALQFTSASNSKTEETSWTTTSDRRRMVRLGRQGCRTEDITTNIHHQGVVKDDLEVILGTATIKLVKQTGIEINTRALCDNGSQVNLISQSVIQQLGKKPDPERTSFIGIGGNKLGTSLGVIWLSMKLKKGDILVNKFYVVKNITCYAPQAISQKWDYLKGHLADEDYNKPGKIHALLGAGIWIQIIEPGLVKSDDRLAVAHNSKLGYIILESRRNPYIPVIPYIGSITKGESNKRLMEQIQRLWEIEEVPRITKRTPEEELCENVFANEHSRDPLFECRSTTRLGS